MQLSNLSLALTAVYGPTALTISQLLPSGAGRVAAIYSDPARPSYDECIQKNMAAIAAGRPQDCVLFADAAGQTPVVYPVGAGQGKGLLLDRSEGLLRGVEALTNGDFSSGSTGWVLTQPTGGTVSVVSGEMRVQSTDGTNAAFIQQGSIAIGKWYEAEFDLRVVSGVAAVQNASQTTSYGTFTTSGRHRIVFLARDTGVAFKRAYGTADLYFANVSVRELPGHHQQQPTAAARGEFSRRYNQLLATATLATQSITAIATQYRLYFTGAGTVTLSGAATGTYSAGSHTITCTAGSLTLTVAGEVLTADLRFEADATIGLPEYQRVTTASDYDEVGFPTYWRAQTDDWAQSHMNPNGATKAYVFWAGQKMSDAARGVIFESSVGTASIMGSIVLTGPDANGADTVGLYTRGSGVPMPNDVTGHAAPKRLVLLAHGDIPADISAISVNGTTTTSATDQGTGTYTEQDVFFGARAGTSLFANIREYAPPMILFLQPADSLSASHLSKLQRGYAKAVGVTL